MSQLLRVAPPSAHTWYQFVEQGVAVPPAEAELVADLFGPEMRRYCEFVQAPAGGPVGLMVRGEGTNFSERVQHLLRAWHMPAAGLAHHAALAHLFEHKRAFLKLEWQPSLKDGPAEHLAAFYFRRRPAVKTMLTRLQQDGVQRAVLEQVAELARLLHKDSIHFVAAALRPGRAIRHKLYFSQYVTPENAGLILQRLTQALAWFGTKPDKLYETHRSLIPEDRATTFFVSLSFEADRLIPSLKLDYADVSPEQAASWLPVSDRPAVAQEVRRFCRTVGVEKLSYLGVRFHRAGPITLKYYGDLSAG